MILRSWSENERLGLSSMAEHRTSVLAEGDGLAGFRGVLYVPGRVRRSGGGEVMDMEERGWVQRVMRA